MSQQFLPFEIAVLRFAPKESLQCTADLIRGDVGCDSGSGCEDGSADWVEFQ